MKNLDIKGICKYLILLKKMVYVSWISNILSFAYISSEILVLFAYKE